MVDVQVDQRRVVAVTADLEQVLPQTIGRIGDLLLPLRLRPGERHGAAAEDGAASELRLLLEE